MKKDFLVLTIPIIILWHDFLRIDNFFIHHTLTDVYLEGTHLPNFKIKKIEKKFNRSGSNPHLRKEEFYEFIPKDKKDYTFSLLIFPLDDDSITEFESKFNVDSSFFHNNNLKVLTIGSHYLIPKHVIISKHECYFFVLDINGKTPRNKIIEYANWWNLAEIKKYKNTYE